MTSHHNKSTLIATIGAILLCGLGLILTTPTYAITTKGTDGGGNDTSSSSNKSSKTDKNNSSDNSDASSSTSTTTNVCNSNANAEIKRAAGCENNAEYVDALPVAVENILYSIIGISGLIAVIFIVVGGVNYITSAGDAGKVEKARKTIIYAAVGLVICVLSFAITNFTIRYIIGGQSNTSEEASDTD